MDIKQILTKAVELNTSDIFFIGGSPIIYKVSGRMKREEEKLSIPELEELIKSIYTMIGREFLPMSERTEDDFSFSLPGLARFRCNAFYQRGTLSAVIRVLKFGIPAASELGIPNEVLGIADVNKGLSLITGPTGSGKSSTIACIIDLINKKYEKNIITMEDPIEFLYRHENSIVIQREVPTDTPTFNTAIKSALRECPDVLFIGELRDSETMHSALIAAEAGRHVISTLHTNSAGDTIDRIIDAFPPEHQSQIRYQLSRVLRIVVCQQLVPGIDGKLYPAFEIMKVTPAIQNLIREGKTFQIPSMIQTGRQYGMKTMAASLNDLAAQGHISRKTLAELTEDPSHFNGGF